MIERFKRGDIVLQLDKRLKGLREGFRQNIAILGRPGLGKTSLIKEYLSTLKGGDLLCVFAELRKDDPSLFVDRFVGSLLFNYLRLTKGDVQPVDIDGLAALCTGRIQKTVEGALRVRELVKRGRIKDAIDWLFELPAILRSETDKPVVVVVDEFQHLASFGIDDPFSILGRKLMMQKETMYVLISSEMEEAKKTLDEKLSLLFGKLELINIEALDAAMSRQFLEWKMPQKHLPNDLAEFTVSFSCGDVLYLDLIASSLNRISAERVTESHLKDALYGLIGHPNGYLNKIFETKLGPETKSAIARLIELSLNRNSSKQMNPQLKQLISRGLVEDHGAFLRIPDLPFRVWLRSVYARREEDFSLNEGYAEEAFLSDITSLLEENRGRAVSDLGKRLLAAMRSFKGERLVLNGKEILLPHSQEIRMRHINDYETLFLLSGKGKQLWAFYLTERPASETEVENFLKIVKSNKPIPSKKVFISANGITTDGAILAKEAKLYLWDRAWLDIIFEFFSPSPKEAPLQNIKAIAS